jgi:putative resolvase
MTHGNSKYCGAAEAYRQWGVSSQSLRRWSSQGKIKFYKTPGGKRFYLAQDLRNLCGDNVREAQTVIYARVSSHHQREDLQRQVADLQRCYPAAQVITDIGSGINWKRAGFTSLLDKVHGGYVKTVVVAHRDRLCRFAADLVESVFARSGCKLVVQDKCDLSPTPCDVTELAEDLLSIVTVFVARHNGRRSANNKRRRDASQKTGEKVGSQKTEKDDEI